ncbi:hypothetical protein OY671_010231 [Metschnikowia pulcherrima]|nr:hypothetical protein OY671_010231 [Metschnikowia pulcherrima]
MGMRVASDDFGTGFANFRTSRASPLDASKLDQSSVRDIAQDPRDRAISRAIVAMARALDSKVVAEGVEDAAQSAVSNEEGCAVFQGFSRSGPVDGAASVAMARD